MLYLSPEKFAMWEKQGGHPLDQAISIASKKSIMRLAGEAAVEGGIAVGSMGIGRLGIGAIQGWRLASKGILVGSKAAALSKTAKGVKVTKYVKPISEGGKAGKKVRKPSRGAALTEAKRIKAGGIRSGIWSGVKQAGATTVKDPFGFMEIRHIVSGVGKIGTRIRYPGKNIVRVSKTKSVDLQAQRRATFLSKYIEPVIFKTSPTYELPKMPLLFVMDVAGFSS